MILRLTIPGKPFGKERPRSTRNGHVYTPEKTRSYEERVRSIFSSQYPNHEPLDGPVSLDIIAVYPMAKSWPIKKHTDAADGKIRPTVRPDMDNIAKIICDALNGLAYKDDCQIVEGYRRKIYGVEPRVCVLIQPVK